MIQLHISGRLVREPMAKTSNSGKPYLSALVAVGAGEREMLATVIAFDGDLQTLLAGLRKGDSVSAMGGGGISAYLDKQGKPTASLTVMATRLMAMADRQSPPRKPRPQHSPDAREYAPDFADDVPF